MESLDMDKCFNPVVMAGGYGSRLWPLSRASFPKQYQQLVDNKNGYTMLQQTFSRISGLEFGLSQLICNQEHRFLAQEQCRSANISTEIVLEPYGRNTAPAVIIAALRLVKAGTDEPMLVLSADHTITNEASFLSALDIAHELANIGNLVTLGVVPSFACVGYGYIKYGANIGVGFEVDAFVEKPDEETAKSYLKQGSYLWNSGMFVFKASVFLKELVKQKPDIAAAMTKASSGSQRDLDFIRVDTQAFCVSASDSIDYAVMEHTTEAIVVPLNAGWSDVGSWDALWKISEKNECNNTLVGDVVVNDVENSYVWSGHRLVSVIGLSDVVVVETADAVMVASLDQAQSVKAVVNHLKDEGREERAFHRKVYRPWGYYEGLDAGATFQVKRLSVNPGASLSLQLHQHRAEHWVVVCGEATVHCDGKDTTLCANQSTYIPVGASHRLENASDEPLYLIEVQSGDYLGEDDIERLEDDFARK